MAKFTEKNKQLKEQLDREQEFRQLKIDINDNLQKIMSFDKNIKVDNEYINNILVKIKQYVNGVKFFNQSYILNYINSQVLDILSVVESGNDGVVIEKTKNLFVFCENYNSINNDFLGIFDDLLGKAYKRYMEKIGEFGELNDVLKNHKTYEIYEKSERLNDTAYKKYIKRAIWFAIGGFILSILISLIFTQCFFEKLCILKYDMVDYWVARVSILLIAITGVTFCLKQAIHHQRKKDKAEQTRLELEALPTYMFNFSDEQKSEVYKELTGKYFGRDFDNEGYQAMSDIIQEQIKLSNEVLKSVISKKTE